MPAVFVPAVKTALSELIGTLFGSEVINTIFTQFAVTITEAILADLNDLMQNWFVNNNMAYMSHNYAMTHVRSTDLTTQNGPSVITAYSPTNGGVNDGTGLPANVALAVKFATEKRGRSFRGRNFLMAIPTTGLATGDADTVNNTLITNLLTSYGQLQTALAAMTPVGTHVVLSRFSNGSPRGTGVMTPVSAYTINNALDSQRRRLRSRGA